ncbi:hypothetical protein GUI12_04395 [Anaplasmataceae bacterium AB001_6]|nr:hypothetical protein GUI12_04395 [Anaplasmataceae bacterium AB001_6]
MISKNFLVLGPTASGKSSAIEFCYNLDNVNVVNSDSKQVYEGVSLLTDQPDIQNIKNVFLYGHIPLTVNYSVNMWFQDILKLFSKNENFCDSDKFNIFIGGSTIYGDCLINGISTIQYPSKEQLDDVKKKISTSGNKEWYNIIAQRFPNQLDHIHYNNTYRLIQESAMLLYTGHNKQYWFKKHGRNRFNLPEIEVLSIIPDDRSQVYHKIEKRLNSMIKDGVIEEIKHNTVNIRDKISNTAQKIHGLKEILDYIDGENTYDQMIAQIAINTRRYAKRQISWLLNKTKSNKVFSDSQSLKEYLKKAIDCK